MLGTTPMFIQYDSIKKEYPNMLLFYRLGDFYELFGEDAIRASKLLDLVLTSRDGGKKTKVPMCGVPFHSASTYINKLVNLGEKIAICEQVTNPKESKGLVERKVIRIITKGTLLDDGTLQKESNYLISVARYYKTYGLSISDVSTGEFLATEFDNIEDFSNEIYRYSPAECICNETDTQIIDILSNIFDKSTIITHHANYAFDLRESTNLLKKHFNVNTLESFGYSNTKAALIAAGALLHYISEAYKASPEHIKKIKFYSTDNLMNLDYSTKNNLELTESLATKTKIDSLLEVIDQCQTATGSRLIKNYLEKPLLDAREINLRLEATESLASNHFVRLSLIEELKNIKDLERIVSKISYQSANPKDLIALKASLFYLPKIKQLIKELDAELFEHLSQNFDILEDIFTKIDNYIVNEPPFSIRDGGIIKPNIHPDIDSNRLLIKDGKAILNKLIEDEREKTGIKTLKLGYNRVFGYYIEVSKSYQDKVPNHYVRKQTLANNERFITNELKELEIKIASANDNLKALEYDLYTCFVEELKKDSQRILNVAQNLAMIDVFQSFATVANNNNWHKPTFTSDINQYVIKNLRHPVVEKKLIDKHYVANDIEFNMDSYFLIITGPNMSGKSTYCRSVACASILAQIGSFIPASEAIIPVVDRIFARIGASDKLSQGQSTFMVEMSEVANIINNATQRSLVILDEVGRGTSTFDGLAIAWSISEYLSQSIRCKTLFATHYHELTELEALYGINNYSVLVEEQAQNIFFLHKIINKAANQSYGIHVAKLAGIPYNILKRAWEILHDLESNQSNVTLNLNSVDTPYNNFESNNKSEIDEFIEKLSNLTLDNLTLIEIANLLFQLKDEAQHLIK